METVELSEFKKLFGNDLVGCTPRKCDHRLFLKIEESNVNVVTFSMDYPSTEILKDILNRAAEALKNINAIIIKNVNDNGISFTVYCKSDPKLKRITCNLNIIKPNQESNPLYDVVAVLRTGKDEIAHSVGTLLPNPMVLSPYSKQYVISKIDETKPIITDFELVNIFKSKFDFNVRYDSRDVGYVLSYLRANRYIYEQPTISREESYKSYIDFCSRNYLKYAFTKHVFGKKIKALCFIKQKLVIDKQIRQYYLSSFGKSCIEDPKIYYAFLKKEADKNKDPDDISYSESFESYFEENRGSYKDYIFTKFEAYEDYEKFCKNNSYQPIPKKTFYRLMLKECIVRRSKEKNGSECFIIEKYSYRNIPVVYITTGVPDEYPKDMKELMEKQIEKIKAKTTRIEEGMKPFMDHYHDDFKSYNYTRTEAFDLYKEYCTTNNKDAMGKIDFYKKMQEYCVERRHRPFPTENPKTYFIIRSEATDVAPDSS